MELGQYHNLIKSYIAVRSEFKVAFYVMSLNAKRVDIYIHGFKKKKDFCAFLGCERKLLFGLLGLFIIMFLLECSS